MLSLPDPSSRTTSAVRHYRSNEHQVTGRAVIKVGTGNLRPGA